MSIWNVIEVKQITEREREGGGEREGEGGEREGREGERGGEREVG